jgi:hypothetical protein
MFLSGQVSPGFPKMFAKIIGKGPIVVTVNMSIGRGLIVLASCPKNMVNGASFSGLKAPDRFNLVFFPFESAFNIHGRGKESIQGRVGGSQLWRSTKTDIF